MQTLKLALDWTPNTNHIGFFVAKALGFYEAEGIQLEITNPSEDNYALTPAKKVEKDIVDFAIAPFESVISLNNKSNPVNAIAIFAVLQNDLSSIASLRSLQLESPKDLDTKIYASYKARYEDHIVKQMIKNDGGEGNLNITYPDKLGIWNTLLEGNADATWIFDNWEGVEAKAKGIALKHFRMKDFGIPYGYSPVVLTKKENIAIHQEAYAGFVKASQRGFLHTQEHPKQARDILEKELTAYDLANVPLDESIAYTAPHFGDQEKCGKMEHQRVVDFMQWLVDHQLEDAKILQQQLYTNDLFL